MYKYKTSFQLKQKYSLWLEELENSSCSNGNYPKYEIRDGNGQVVQSGLTCRCGRRCSNTDCIRDDWGDHDTDIEEFRVRPRARRIVLKLSPRCIRRAIKGGN